MDNIKDNKPGNVESRPSTKDIKDNNPIDFFSKNQSFVFVYKKTEKLATALYMVTNLFGDAEPMKWTLRSKVSNLLSFIIGFKDVVGARVDEFSNDVKTQVLEIVSLLEIASRSGLVSHMNFSILKSEFMNTISFLSDSGDSIGNPFPQSYHRANLKEDFFNVGQHAGYQNKGQSIGRTDQGRSYKTTAVENVPHQLIDNDLEHLGHDAQQQKYSNRQTIILGLLKRKKSVVIQDVAQVITDCSEKTLQRELISLVHKGLVKRVGERRWSKYTLVDF